MKSAGQPSDWSMPFANDALGMTFHALAEQTGLAVNTIKNIAHDLIEELERTVHYETPVIMGIDEVSI
jgi:transposase